MPEIGEQNVQSQKNGSNRRFADAAYEEVNVLVTGFRDADGFNEDPSWLIAKSLPPFLECNSAHPSRTRITVPPEPLRATFEAAGGALKSLLEPDQVFNLILHIGVSPEPENYKVERFGRAKGYKKPDANGKLPSNRDEIVHWNNDAKLRTSAALEDVFPRWEGETTASLPNRLGKAPLTLLRGRSFLSQKTLVSTLASTFSILRSRTSSLNAIILSWDDCATVELLHVPSGIDDASIKNGREIAVALIMALIDSRRQRHGDFDEDGNRLG